MEEETTDFVPGYRIRRVSDRDVVRVGEIAQLAWVRVHDSFRKIVGDAMHDTLWPDWEEKKDADVRRHREQYPDWSRVVETVETDHVVGFITFRVDEKKGMGIIGNNAVHPEHQGRGIATAMYAHVLDLFRRDGLRYACVGTGLDEGHTPARRAYEKAGFDIALPAVTYYTYL